MDDREGSFFVFNLCVINQCHICDNDDDDKLRKWEFKYI